MPIALVLVVPIAAAIALLGLATVAVRSITSWRRAERDLAARQARALDRQR